MLPVTYTEANGVRHTLTEQIDGVDRRLTLPVTLENRVDREYLAAKVSERETTIGALEPTEPPVRRPKHEKRQFVGRRPWNEPTAAQENAPEELPRLLEGVVLIARAIERTAEGLDQEALDELSDDIKEWIDWLCQELSELARRDPQYWRALDTLDRHRIEFSRLPKPKPYELRSVVNEIQISVEPVETHLKQLRRFPVRPPRSGPIYVKRSSGSPSSTQRRVSASMAMARLERVLGECKLGLSEHWSVEQILEVRGLELDLFESSKGSVVSTKGCVHPGSAYVKAMVEFLYSLEIDIGGLEEDISSTAKGLDSISNATELVEAKKHLARLKFQLGRSIYMSRSIESLIEEYKETLLVWKADFDEKFTSEVRELFDSKNDLVSTVVGEFLIRCGLEEQPNLPGSALIGPRKPNRSTDLGRRPVHPNSVDPRPQSGMHAGAFALSGSSEVRQVEISQPISKAVRVRPAITPGIG